MKHIITLLITAFLTAANAEAKPLKVFILVGQSNMEGPASIETFDYMTRYLIEHLPAGPR